MKNVRTRKTTQELFNDYIQYVLNTTKKIEHDLCIDTFKLTGLYDFSYIIKDAEIINKTPAIPQSSVFIKVNEDTQIFFNDFNAENITGCYCRNNMTNKRGVFNLNYPFVINLKANILNMHECYSIASMGKQDLMKELEIRGFEPITAMAISLEIQQNIRKALSIFMLMNKNIVLIDDNSNSKPKYYRYNDKNKGVIRFNPKPTYIVLSEEKHKTLKNYDNIISNGKIERCFSFPVMGHWRRLSSQERIGKDKQDNYTIQGYTWVKDFIKGNKDMPLIKKEKIVLQ